MKETKVKIFHSCDICSKKFDSKKDLRRHIEAVHEGKKENKCDFCGKAFFMKSRLEVHIKDIHGEGNREKTHKCKQCSKLYLSRNGLKNHILVEHEKVTF